MTNIYINVFLQFFILIAVPGFLILKFFKTNNKLTYYLLKVFLLMVVVFLSSYKSYSDFSVMKEGYQKLVSLKLDDVEYIRVQKSTKHNKNPTLDKFLKKNEIITFISLLKVNQGCWTEKYNKNIWKFWVYFKGNEKILILIDENNKIIFQPKYKNKSVGYYRNDKIFEFLKKIEQSS